jgi:hypothetical protein
MDPYAVVEVGNQKFRTHTKSGKNPVWNEQFGPISIVNENTFTLTLWDKDTCECRAGCWEKVRVRVRAAGFLLHTLQSAAHTARKMGHHAVFSHHCCLQ